MQRKRGREAKKMKERTNAASSDELSEKELQEALEANEKPREDEVLTRAQEMIAKAQQKPEEEEDVDVVEIFSPPRVTEAAKIIGLKAGLAMDLTTGWDFNVKAHRDAAEEYVRRVKPWLVIGSPECKIFSALQHIDKA